MRFWMTWSILLGSAWAAAHAAETIALFDGKTLDGWSGNPNLWSVEDGMIVGRTTGLSYNTFLITDEDYDNFELTFEAKLDANNSGVQVRSEIVDPQKFVLAGYQADIAEGYWGLLYEERKRGKLDFDKDVTGLAKLGEWATYKVRAEGPRITIWVNGEKTVDYTEKDPDKGSPNGRIGLQLHAGPAMTVWFKNIRLTKLD